MCKRVLIVDDDKIVREFLAVALAKQAEEIVEASSGEEGLQRVTDGVFDLIITDNNMPGGMTGKEMVARIRRIPEKGSTPIILLSGDVGLTCEACDVDAIVRKPFRLDALRMAADLVG